MLYQPRQTKSPILYPSAARPDYLVYDSILGEIFAGEQGTIQVISDSKNQVSQNLQLANISQCRNMAYNSNKGEIYIDDGTSVAIISDQKYNVIGTVNTNGTGTTSGGIDF